MSNDAMMSSEMAATDLQSWFETPLGAYLLAAEQGYFDHEVADVFGFNALQLGLCRFDFLRANRMPLHCRTGEARKQMKPPAACGCRPTFALFRC